MDVDVQPGTAGEQSVSGRGPTPIPWSPYTPGLTEPPGRQAFTYVG